MVHYIRFLRTPQTGQANKKTIDVTGVLTITTDLGDSFYGKDAELEVRVVDATKSNEVLCVQTVAWQDGTRAVKINISCNLKFMSRLVSLNVTTVDTARVLACRDIPEIMDVWSEAFHLDGGRRTEPLVERRLSLYNKSPLRVWEETGDSIARHIW